MSLRNRLARCGYLADVAWTRCKLDRVILLRPLILMRAPVQRLVPVANQVDHRRSDFSDRSTPWTFQWVDRKSENFESLCAVTHYRPPTDQRTIGFAAKLTELAGEPSAVIGGLWVSLHRFHEDDGSLAFELPSQTAWLHSARVHPGHRRKGVYRGLISELLRGTTGPPELRDITEFCWSVHRLNRRSVAAHQSFASSAERAWVWRLGPCGGLFAHSSIWTSEPGYRVPGVVPVQTESPLPTDCGDRHEVKI